MNGKTLKRMVADQLARGGGVLRLAPSWVPRSFMIPGGRLKLDPRDLYALGADRGGINERWLASTTRADNGPGTPDDEGMSYVLLESTSGIRRILLAEVVAELGEELLGPDVMEKHGGWQVLCKFFDNQGPIPLHVHQMDEHAANVGKRGKPEAYYFPPQMNVKLNDFPYTFFGLNPGTRREEIAECLANWDRGDNGILRYSRAYKLEPGTGWRVPAGVLHAPGSLVTYEPQRPYDIFGMFQSLVEGRPVPRQLLVKDVPKEHHDDLEYLLDMLDWEENTDPRFAENHLCLPRVEERDDAFVRKAVVYGSEDFGADELTVAPGQSALLVDDAPYGVITVQGRGAIAEETVETPTVIRYGDLTRDEFFVSYEAARSGVTVTNHSDCEPLVMLRHFGPR